MNTFPLELNKHIVFCIIGFIFFMIQFFRQGYKYQIISAFAIASTLLLYVNASLTWRYALGIVELIMVIAIFVVMSVEKKKEEQKAEAAKAAANAVSEISGGELKNE
ncbi:hypothetical protein [Ruminococcus sp. HUN007]|uniref:hypothetical protein n=1 Tax=Ruminococcus sp. HUN007 TaxID=1514668 RepID=UPI0005D1D4B7|nr:hypothetical protein [Ruminococcus sp. HUN007]